MEGGNEDESDREQKNQNRPANEEPLDGFEWIRLAFVVNIHAMLVKSMKTAHVARKTDQEDGGCNDDGPVQAEGAQTQLHNSKTPLKMIIYVKLCKKRSVQQSSSDMTARI